jgi:hypothetical protein
MEATMMSTSTQFNGNSQNTPQASPLITSLSVSTEVPALQNYFFQQSGQSGQSGQSEQTEYIPNPSTVMRNLLTYQTQEIREHAKLAVPRVSATQTIKKTFREFYQKETHGVFQFLDTPVNPTIHKSREILKRFGRADYSASRVKTRDLLFDTTISAAIENLAPIFAKPSQDLAGWISHTRGLIDSWRQATSDLATAEAKLSGHLALFSDIHAKVKAILTLPEGDGYNELTRAAEDYIRNTFHIHKLEEVYQEYLISLKKVSVLVDALGAIRAIVNTPSEPLCSVCFVEPVTLASVPCGHTFCSSCGSRQSITCYICRAPVEDRLKIYFS